MSGLGRGRLVRVSDKLAASGATSAPDGTSGPSRRATRLIVAGVTGGLVTASAIGTTGFLSYLARLLLLPDRKPLDDVQIQEVDGDTITLSLTTDTVMPGRYGLWFPEGHLRLGDVLYADESAVTRVLETVDEGSPQPGPARWNGWYHYRDPEHDLGLAYQDVQVSSDVGMLPTWLVPPPGQADTDARARRWAILVHGRGGQRPECLRAVPVLHGAGLTCLIPSYRNDLDAPASPDGRYNLGLSEWHDVEATLQFALDAGAQDIVVFGWSMGGAAVLQLLSQSPLADTISAVVLDSPVVDWGRVIRHHAAAYRVPLVAAASVTYLIGQRWARHLVGVQHPLDVAQTNWEQRAGELRHPMLIMHSQADDIVPIGPSAALAAARPDLVRWQPWTEGLHTQLWNLDPVRWERAVSDLLAEHHATR